MTEVPGNFRDRTGEIYGEWKVTGFNSKHYQPCGKPDFKWNVVNVDTGEQKVVTLTNLLNLKAPQQEKCKQRRKEYYKKNKEWQCAKTLENYYKNHEHRRAVAKAYYEKNKEKLREYGREYQRKRYTEQKEQCIQSIKKCQERTKNNKVLAGQSCKEPTTTLGQCYKERYASQCKKPQANLTKWTKEYRREYNRQYNAKKKLTKKVDNILSKYL